MQLGLWQSSILYFNDRNISIAKRTHNNTCELQVQVQLEVEELQINLIIFC